MIANDRFLLTQKNILTPDKNEAWAANRKIIVAVKFYWNLFPMTKKQQQQNRRLNSTTVLKCAPWLSENGKNSLLIFRTKESFQSVFGKRKRPQLCYMQFVLTNEWSVWLKINIRRWIETVFVAVVVVVLILIF